MSAVIDDSGTKFTDGAPGKAQRWGQERRLEFIDFRLLWDGRINRGQLVDFFGISTQQASFDLSIYASLAPNNLSYNKSQKAYLVGDQFKPLLTPFDAQSLLSQLWGVTAGILPTTMSFLGFRPSCDVVQFPARKIDPHSLINIIWAIRDHQKIHVTYQSMRRPEAGRRWIAPHAIGFDGSRWHARAWCYENNAFRDFVLTRIQAIHETESSDIDECLDKRWNTYVDVILCPRSDLTTAQRNAVALEFGMDKGTLSVRIREALVYYLVRQLQLDQQDHSVTRAYPIEWVNRSELISIVMEA
jgi:predicted DNA-binding transcriptional regulator YafY